MDESKRSASESPEEQPRKVRRTGESSGESERERESGELSSDSEDVASESESVGGEGIGGSRSGEQRGEQGSSRGVRPPLGYAKADFPSVSEQSSGGSSGELSSDYDSSESGSDSSEEIPFELRTNRDSYTADLILGSGTYGTVWRALRERDSHLVAIKVLDHLALPQETIAHEVNMANIFIRHPHANVMIFYETHDTPRATFLICEFSPIGDIYEAMQIVNAMGERIWTQFDENQTRYLIKNIGRGLQHLHGLGIAHGDLKLQNVLLFPNPVAVQYHPHPITTIDKWIAKLCDFSNTQIGENVNEPILYNHPLCAMAYAAPESYEGVQYDCIKADIFSLGCCLLSMVLGASPFGNSPPIEAPINPLGIAQYQQHVNTFVNKSKYDTGYKARILKVCSKPLKNLLEGMLLSNPQNRFTLRQFFAHEWISRPQSREFMDVSGRMSLMTTHPFIEGLRVVTYADY